MSYTGNYLIQADQARSRFLEFDQEQLQAKFGLKMDEQYLYVNLLKTPYRIDRRTGNLEKQAQGRWGDGNSFQEVMTLLDLLCDSREDRSLTGRWKNMNSFGLQFHQNLLEQKKDPDALWIQEHPEKFLEAGKKLGAGPVEGCDLGFAAELFDGLRIGVQFWYGDEEFAPRIRFLWDENALQYLHYETMFYAAGLLTDRIRNG